MIAADTGVRSATGAWNRVGFNCLILGPTGVEKTWIVCAFAQQACRQGFTTRYLHAPRLFEELPPRPHRRRLPQAHAQHCQDRPVTAR